MNEVKWPVTWIMQQDPKGCLVATIAMIAGATYQEARSAFPGLAPGQCLGRYEAHQWLKERGFEVITTLKYFRDARGKSTPHDP